MKTSIIYSRKPEIFNTSRIVLFERRIRKNKVRKRGTYIMIVGTGISCNTFIQHAYNMFIQQFDTAC